MVKIWRSIPDSLQRSRSPKIKVAGDQCQRRFGQDAYRGNEPNLYSLLRLGKSTFRDLPGNEILWASERSGWNHLYRYDRDSGKLINAVTSGNWNVKRIHKIDMDQETIWFYAVGIHHDQDPYHEHFCRVKFDGSNLRVLTIGDGTHQIQFQPKGDTFVDTYSRVDMAPVRELRDSQTGKLIAQLNRQDTEKQFGKRRLTERFVAKGRDGKTDIWGIIHWPINFDPSKKYPVVENIYAGPHDHHVPKAFRTGYGHRHAIADAGMIVVQIDGMGTAWRSKEFHDVCFKNLRDAGFPDRIAWLKAAAKDTLKWICPGLEFMVALPADKMRWRRCYGTAISTKSPLPIVDVMTIGWIKSGGMNSGWDGQSTRAIRKIQTWRMLICSMAN